MLKLFSSPRCMPCKILKKKLLEKGIIFEEINVETDEGLKEAEKYGVTAVPTIIKDDELIVVGLPKKQLEEELWENLG